MPSQAFFKIKEEKRAKIMHSCIKEMSMRTFDNLRISNIVRDAKIPRGSFYYYFEDKLDMYTYVSEHVFNQKIKIVKRLKNEHYGNFFELVDELLVDMGQYIADFPEYFSIGVLITSDENAEHARSFISKRSELVDELTVVVEASKKQGVIKEELSSHDIVMIFLRLFIEINIQTLFGTENYVSECKKLINILKVGIQNNG